MDIKINFVERTIKNDEMCNSFDCGNSVLDNFLRNESCDTDISKTYLMIEDDVKLIGFYSLTCSSLLEINDKNKNVESYIPAICLKMFAIDKKYQDIKITGYGHTYAHFMLTACIDKIKEIKDHYVGAECIILNSTKDGYELYKNVGDFHKLDGEYKLPDYSENPNAIKMYRSIYSKI